MNAPRTVSVLATMAIALGACAESPGPTAEPAASATPRPTSRPTSTPTPVDRAAAFQAAFASTTSMEAELSGRLEFGGLTGEFSGSMRTSAGSTHVLSTLTFPGQPPHEEEWMNVAGKQYTMVPLGFWLQSEPTAADASNPVAMAFSDVMERLVADGTEAHDGGTLHRLVFADQPEFGTEGLGIPGAGADLDAEFAFLAHEDGAPAGFVMRASWTEGPSGPGLMEIVYRFTSLNSVFSIEPPRDAWQMHVSEQQSYRMAYPIRWDTTHVPEEGEYEAYDRFVGPFSEEIHVHIQRDLEHDWLPNEWKQAAGDWMEEWHGVRPDVVEDLIVGEGLPARVFAVLAEDDGKHYFIQQATIFGGDRGWDLIWWSDPGDEETDTQFFMNFVRTFEPTWD
jgi:hypothetical protein